MHGIRFCPQDVTTPKDGHWVLLDWLRFLTALLVVLCHARPDHWVAWAELDADSQGIVSMLFFLLIRPGPEAVVVFFVLSGYLVGASVIRRCVNGAFSASEYFVNRAARIATPLFPAILLTIGCVGFVQPRWPAHYIPEILGNLLQMQGILTNPMTGNPPLWSLSYEVWFYVLAGALGMAWTNRGVSSSKRLLAGAAILALLSFGCVVILDMSYFVCWLLGALAGLSPLKFPGRNLTCAGVIGVLLAVALSQATNPQQGGLLIQSPWLHRAGTVLLGISISFLLPVLVQAGERLRHIPFTRHGSQLAAFSYTLYLTHFPLLLVMRSWHEPYRAMSLSSIWLYVCKIVICLIVAMIFYLSFERHTEHVRQWLKARLSVGSQTSPQPDHA
jgi:peptidoglycan/LPS O-acetylase OafA/YrhL